TTSAAPHSGSQTARTVTSTKRIRPTLQKASSAATPSSNVPVPRCRAERPRSPCSAASSARSTSSSASPRARIRSSQRDNPTSLPPDPHAAAQERGLSRDVVAHPDRDPLIAAPHQQGQSVNILLVDRLGNLLLGDRDRHRRLHLGGVAVAVDGGDEDPHLG